MSRRVGFVGRSLLLAASCLLALSLLQSCARKQNASSSTAQSTGQAPGEFPGSLSELLKSSGFAIPEKPFAAEDFTLGALDGSRASLSSFKGKVVFLSFWATWCGPCKAELPSIEALYNKLSSRGLVVVAVDLGEEKAKVAKFVKANNLTFPVLLDGDLSIGSEYGANSIPTNYLLDRSGRVIARIVGFDGTDWTSSQRLDLFDRILKL